MYLYSLIWFNSYNKYYFLIEIGEMIEETAVDAIDAAKTFEKLEFGNLDLNY